jgi:hypothetical protein
MNKSGGRNDGIPDVEVAMRTSTPSLTMRWASVVSEAGYRTVVVRPFRYTTMARCASSSSVALRIAWLSTARTSPVYEEILAFPLDAALTGELLAKVTNMAVVSTLV